jgi:hypothetical protein
MNSELPIILHRNVPIDDNVSITAGPLDASPFTTRKIMGHFNGQDAQLLVVINDDVRSGPFDEGTSIEKPSTLGGQC